MSAMVSLAKGQSVRGACVAVVRDVLGGLRPIEDGTRFHADLGADSIDMVSIAVALEEELGIAIPDDVAAGAVTVGDMINAATTLFESGDNR